jgi:hypothetical protein
MNFCYNLILKAKIKTMKIMVFRFSKVVRQV